MANDEMKPSGTRAHAPDLDWSQVRETVLMMELASAQIEAAMKESSSSVEVLTRTFTTMAGHMRTIGEAVGALPDSGADKARLQGATEQVSGMVNQAIVAFQFYDKLVQRLSHVNHSLDALADLVGDKSRLYNPEEWVALQQKIRAKYSMREEVEMFEAVLAGVPVEEAIEQFMAKVGQKSGDIELF